MKAIPPVAALKSKNCDNTYWSVMRRLFILLSLLAVLAFGKSERPSISDNTGTIYLTFDDCPGRGSRYINEVIATEQIRANVFFIGEYSITSEEMINNVKLYKNNPLMECGNHGFRHFKGSSKRFYNDTWDMLNDLAFNQYLLGLENRICRIPGENAWALPGRLLVKHRAVEAVASYLQMSDYKVFGWDIEWKSQGKCQRQPACANEIYQSIKNAFVKKQTFTEGHLVLNCRDWMFGGRNGQIELTALVKKLKAEGYQFEYLSNYPDVSLVVLSE